MSEWDVLDVYLIKEMKKRFENPFQLEQSEPFIFFKPEFEMRFWVEVRKELRDTAKTLAVNFCEKEVDPCIPSLCIQKCLR